MCITASKSAASGSGLAPACPPSGSAPPFATSTRLGRRPGQSRMSLTAGKQPSSANAARVRSRARVSAARGASASASSTVSALGLATPGKRLHALPNTLAAAALPTERDTPPVPESAEFAISSVPLSLAESSRLGSTAMRISSCFESEFPRTRALRTAAASSACDGLGAVFPTSTNANERQKEGSSPPSAPVLPAAADKERPVGMGANVAAR
mmetsp:Transcript_21898/g.55538  ORF Transcript_21898/g.55538 Transcript_21898/m.55538 type:complete len:212 (-) Transcript_21898:1332-1967(-)